jgi:hypothetical protein
MGANTMTLTKDDWAERIKAGLLLVGCIPVIIVIILWAATDRAPSVPAAHSPSQYWSSDEERLEWRSRHHLPMTDEDIRYEQKKLMDAVRKIEASERRIGR